MIPSKKIFAFVRSETSPIIFLSEEIKIKDRGSERKGTIHGQMSGDNGHEKLRRIIKR